MGLKVFIAQIVHELANSLNGVDTGIQLLERRMSKGNGGHDESIMALVREIRAELGRHRTLLDELRSFSHPGKFTLQPVDLVTVTEDILRTDSMRFEEQGIEVIAEMKPSLPLVIGNADKLGQVVRNICKNACEAMPDGGTLTIRGYRGFATVTLEITDTGTGIPPGIDVFEEFISTKINGMGLGLTIVNEIIAAHGGDINYTSEQGQGTSFRLTLPAAFFSSPGDKTPAPPDVLVPLANGTYGRTWKERANKPLDKRNITRAGVAVTRAIERLERGEDNEIDIECGSGKIRVVNDPENGRAVVIERVNLREQRRRS